MKGVVFYRLRGWADFWGMVDEAQMVLLPFCEFPCNNKELPSDFRQRDSEESIPVLPGLCYSLIQAVD